MRSHTVISKSRYGLRGVRVGEASNPGPPRTRARVRMEQEAEAEATLSCLEAALTHIDDSDDDPLGGTRSVNPQRWVDVRMSGTSGTCW